MTREEAITYAKRLAVDFGLNDETQAFCDIIIKALEKEPCDDCISRKDVEEMIKAEMPERGMWEIEGDKEKETICEVCVDLMQKLSELPFITPARPTGHWKELEKIISPNELICECSVCSHILSFLNYYPKSNYCPNCGAKMEREDDRD